MYFSAMKRINYAYPISTITFFFGGVVDDLSNATNALLEEGAALVRLYPIMNTTVEPLRVVNIFFRPVYP